MGSPFIVSGTRLLKVLSSGVVTPVRDGPSAVTGGDPRTVMSPVGHPGLSAWSDESFQEKDSAGFYIIAAAVIEPQMLDAARSEGG
ncbi:hypothetical protein [Streptomyces sp. RKCA744]|uniref:hypothetical protein n=1 Tax=Streptomyces sp. RKCA744 TaxID=2959340 RepID=UPI0020A180CA|nr:hypothetical protein [Streptomyces sp. RKCA744]MCO8308803.1 hypothetical protein [Streptomyces sp. RKCA744]